MNIQNNNGTTILGTLIKNEELLSKLYNKYSQVFIDDTKFWNEISNDETEHASWIYDLSVKVSNGDLYISNDRFTNETFISFGEYVNEQIENANTDGMTSIDALSIAKNVENSMLETALFKIYDTDDPQLKLVLDKLKKSTELHCAEVKKRWQQELNNS